VSADGAVGGAAAVAGAAVSGVVDPEIRVVTIAELGILRGLAVDGGRVTVTITPTYSGCPAMDVIRSDIRQALRDVGFGDIEIVTVLRPAWSTDMISASGLERLAAAGIAPPGPAAPPGEVGSTGSTGQVGQVGSNGSTGSTGPVALTLSVRCPQCGSPDTEELSRFGSTACKALWRCRACAEPFDRLKPL
jgi:ring-1,2-phenylacetyl-CoA epoxidase subunit PaaD